MRDLAAKLAAQTAREPVDRAINIGCLCIMYDGSGADSYREFIKLAVALRCKWSAATEVSAADRLMNTSPAVQPSR